MPATEPIQAGPYPVPSDAPDGPNQMSAIVAWTAGRLNMRFASTTTRDAAIPTPTEGMVAYTGTGAALTEWLYKNAAWQDTTFNARPVTGVNMALALATQTDYTGLAIVVQGTVSVVAGRKYEVSAWLNGLQQTSTGTVTAQLSGTAGVPTTKLVAGSYTAAATVIGSTTALYEPTVSTTMTFQLTASTSAGSLRIATRAAQIWVTDVTNS